MCGLTGMLGPGISVWDLEVLEQLTYVSSLRGTDGTGILQAESYVKNKYFVEKSRQDSPYFLWYNKRGKGNRKVLNHTYYNLFAVHVRAATKGNISDENAHPFDLDGIVGMHNGTLVDTKYWHKDKTDSEMLLRDIDERGIKPVLRELNPKSAYALVIYDKETEEVHFIRNSDRTLYVCFHNFRNVMYWASERWMLSGILGRNKEKILKDEIYHLDPGFVYTITPKNLNCFKGSPFRKSPIFSTESQPTNVTSVKIENKREVAKKETVTQDNRSMKEVLKQWGPKPKEDTSCKIPKIHCCNPSCAKEMSLVERYFGEKLSDAVYLCAECKEDFPYNTGVSIN